jgi:hypothetical protein
LLFSSSGKSCRRCRLRFIDPPSRWRRRRHDALLGGPIDLGVKPASPSSRINIPPSRPAGIDGLASPGVISPGVVNSAEAKLLLFMSAVLLVLDRNPKVLPGSARLVMVAGGTIMSVVFGDSLVAMGVVVLVRIRFCCKPDDGDWGNTTDVAV